MFGPPCRRPPGDTVLIQVWTYVIRHSVKRNPRNTFDGSPITGKGVQYAKNYAVCASQHGFKTFPALYTAFGYTTMVYGDINAYDQ